MNKLLFLVLIALILGLTSSDIFEDEWNKALCTEEENVDNCVTILKLLLRKYEIYDQLIILLNNGAIDSAKEVCFKRIKSQKLCDEVINVLFKYLKYIG